MKEINILLADDELEIRELLQKYLNREGYTVDAVADGETAIKLFKEKEYNLVIQDIMLPGIDGIDVCQVMRRTSNVPIIMLTARDDEVDKVLGLRIGADDYITKPFIISELLARVKAQLRRFMILGGDIAETRKSEKTELGDLQIDLVAFRVYKKDVEIKITSTEFNILKLLMTYPDRVFTKKQIFNEVWGDDYLEADNNVMVHIRRLRKKIEDNPQEPRYIKTVWGIGYRFAGDE